MSTAQDELELRCPTCGARQARCEQCRRCKCDLRLLLAALDERARWKRLALRRLRDGRHEEALAAARRCWSLAPDRDSARLLAVAGLLSCHYANALAAYDAAPSP